MQLSVEEQLRVIMKRRGETLQSVAEKLGTSKQNVHMHFKGGFKSVEILRNVADVLDCDIDIQVKERL